MICVYKITSPSKKVYIGSTIDFEKRILFYKSMSGKRQRRLYNSFKKYGFDNHKIEILSYCDLEDVRQKEAYYGHLFNCLGKNGLNCSLPKHGEKFTCISEETRKKLSLAQKGRKLSKESLQKFSLSRMGHIVSEETRQKLKNVNTGKKHSEETKRKMAESQKKRPPSTIETKLKISQSRVENKYALGYKRTERECQMIKERCCHILLNIQTGIYYYGYGDAAKSIGVKRDWLYYQMSMKHDTPFIIT